MMRVIILACTTLSSITDECIPIDFGMGSVICQCNSTYCDFYPDPSPSEKGEFIWYVTSKSGKRLSRRDDKISEALPEYDTTVTIKTDKEYQKMRGFGGAFTDSTGINIKKLSQGCQDNILRSYFSTDGSNYNFGRVPISGTDFSTRPYTYDDFSDDTLLEHFSLAPEDGLYKIPLMKKALEINPTLRFFASSWSAPPWMKSNGKINGYGYLLREHYQTYANYILSFLEAYQNVGLSMWAITTGNEPATSLTAVNRINNMFWSPITISDWLLNNFLPILENSNCNETIIMVLDDQRFNLPWYMIDLKKYSKKILKHISGIAVHWYFDDVIPPAALDITHEEFSDKFLLMTESCLGYNDWDQPKVSLGSWSRMEELVSKMFQNFNHWVTGWVDWNLVLDTTGGPNWANNSVDAPIIVVPEQDVFYKQPLFYAMSHFSKFVPRESVRVKTQSKDENILSIAFKTDDNQIIVVLYNQNDMKKNISIVDEQVGSINIELPEKSLHTILYNNIV